MPKKQQALEILQQRWREIFSILCQGGEVAPAQRLRAEGFMQACVQLELASESSLQEAMQMIYQECYEQPLPPGWQDLFPFPQIPGFGQRAPVYPSTPD